MIFHILQIKMLSHSLKKIVLKYYIVFVGVHIHKMQFFKKNVFKILIYSCFYNKNKGNFILDIKANIKSIDLYLGNILKMFYVK